MEPFLDSLGNPIYVKGEIIIRFNTSVVKKQAIDDPDLQFGDAQTFLKDTVIQLMNSVLPQVIDKLMFVKIFTSLTSNDTIHITNYGDTVKIPSLWTAFRMTTVINGDEIQYSDTLLKFRTS